MRSLAKASRVGSTPSCAWLVVVCWLGACARDQAAAPAERVALVQAGLESAFSARDDTVSVIVNFHEPPTQRPLIATRRAAIRRMQDDVLTKNCVWSINGGLDPVRTSWTIDNSAENGDIDKDKKPTVEQVANIQLAKEAVEAAGGPVTIVNCKD